MLNESNLLNDFVINDVEIAGMPFLNL